MTLNGLTDEQLKTLYWRLRRKLDSKEDKPITQTWTLRKAHGRVSWEQHLRIKERHNG